MLVFGVPARSLLVFSHSHLSVMEASLYLLPRIYGQSSGEQWENKLLLGSICMEFAAGVASVGWDRRLLPCSQPQPLAV